MIMSRVCECFRIAKLILCDIYKEYRGYLEQSANFEVFLILIEEVFKSLIFEICKGVLCVWEWGFSCRGSLWATF